MYEEHTDRGPVIEVIKRSETPIGEHADLLNFCSLLRELFELQATSFTNPKPGVLKILKNLAITGAIFPELWRFPYNGLLVSLEPEHRQRYYDDREYQPIRRLQSSKSGNLSMSFRN